MGVTDGKHQPAPEQIVVHPVVSGADYPRAGELFLGITLPDQMVLQRLPIGRTESHAKGLDGLFVQSALLEVFPGGCSLGGC